ncbi:Bro8 [Heliothis virescens ascovirus 3j]|uniref:Bro8 n=1 Tax=Heliothis virescens ascovirus 3j TaxID=1561067 RepID=A0A2Z5V8M1_9VIRU|nr:Bro8 [Heliothis virescens ascovirus 3j]
MCLYVFDFVAMSFLDLPCYSNCVGANNATATLQSERSTWIAEIDSLKRKVCEKDKKIAELNDKLTSMTAHLIQSNASLVSVSNDLVTARRDTVKLANRIADITQAVVAKPSVEECLHSLVMHSMISSRDTATNRSQKRSIDDRTSYQEQNKRYHCDGGKRDEH